MSSATPWTAREPHRIDYARLIPGDFPGGDPCPGKKPAQSLKDFGSRNFAELATNPKVTPETVLGRFLPTPLTGRKTRIRVQATAADVALVSLSWLVIGALLIPLRIAFPRVQAYEAGAPAALLGTALLHAALITLVGYTEGLYSARTTSTQQARILGKSVLWATIVLSVGYGLQGSFEATIPPFLCAGLLQFGALWAWRWQSIHQKLAEQPHDCRNVIIVGAGATGRRVASFLQTHPRDGRVLYGFVDDSRQLGNGVIGRISELGRLARAGFVDEIILAAPRDREQTQRVLREAARLRLDVEIVPELFGCRMADADPDRLGDLPLICLRAEPVPAAALAVKRMVDVSGSGLALLALSPLLAVIALLIRLDSPGPILYCAPRAGRKGRLFRCYKFRTMVTNADAQKDHLRGNNERSGPIFKIAADPRITRLGRLLRRYSLDELPQLWNVVKGEMSLVGPRPHPVDDYAGYEIEHLARLDVTPGITGLWQVTARSDPSFDRGMELDRKYIRTWSLGSDARIMAKTMVAVARGSGQ